LNEKQNFKSQRALRKSAENAETRDSTLADEASVTPTELFFLQGIQLRQDFGAVFDRIDAGVGLGYFSRRVDQEGVPCGELYYAEIGQ
jgi:hypothetical protein